MLARAKEGNDMRSSGSGSGRVSDGERWLTSTTGVRLRCKLWQVCWWPVSKASSSAFG